MEAFGFGTDENGDINFMEVRTDFEVTDFETYKELFKQLFKIAIENPGVMPVPVFHERED